MNDDKTAPTCGTLAPNGFDSERLDDILGRADCPDNYDGDEAQEWIIDQRILPDLKYLADAYRAIARPAEVATRSGITESLMVYTKRFGNKTIPIDRQALPRSEPIAVDDPIWPACGACWHVHLAGNRCGSWGCTCAVGGYLPESVTTYEARSGITEGGRRVIAERSRQIESEGWTPEHDAQHDSGDLVDAALCYIESASTGGRSYRWPWDQKYFKPTTPVRDLEKAGALIVAEIDRLLTCSGIDVGVLMQNISDRAHHRSGITPSGDPIHAAWVAYWTKATNGQCETNHTAHAAFLAGAAASAPTNEPAVALVQEWRYRTACASESAITKAGDDLAAFIESLGPRNAKRPPSR